MIAVPGDRLIVAPYGLFVLIPGSAGGWRVNGLSTGLFESPQYAAHLKKPMGKPREIGVNQYFAIGDEGGGYFVDVIETGRIANEVPDDQRVPHLPWWIHQAHK